MVNFIYLAHSAERFRKQAVFSILSLLEYVDNSELSHRIVVYTDQPDYFKCLKVDCQLVDAATLEEWKGPKNFVHRSKVRVMLDAAEKFEGRLMFLDSDNCVFQDPVPMLKNWNDDSVIMEKLEYVLEKPADLVGKKYKRFFKKQSEFAGYQVNMTQDCWNSGIIGLPESAKTLLPDILKVCDSMHDAFNKHLSEQMAFSIVLSHHFKVVPFNGHTYHWFGHGKAVNQIIENVLNDYPSDDLESLISRISSVKSEVRAAPINRDKLTWYKRWLKA